MGLADFMYLPFQLFDIPHRVLLKNNGIGIALALAIAPGISILQISIQIGPRDLLVAQLNLLEVVMGL